MHSPEFAFSNFLSCVWMMLHLYIYQLTLEKGCLPFFQGFSALFFFSSGTNFDDADLSLFTRVGG